jgi:hypothetical protein
MRTAVMNRLYLRRSIPMLIALAFVAFLVMIASWVAAPTHERTPLTSSAMPMQAPQAAD